MQGEQRKPVVVRGWHETESTRTFEVKRGRADCERKRWTACYDIGKSVAIDTIGKANLRTLNEKD